MKSTGIVRRIDDLGRVVLPVELRRTLDLEVRDPVEIFIEGDAIVLRKYDAACLFCGATRELLSYRGKQICRSCLRRLRGNKRINKAAAYKAYAAALFVYLYPKITRLTRGFGYTKKRLPRVGQPLKYVSG